MDIFNCRVDFEATEKSFWCEGIIFNPVKNYEMEICADLGRDLRAVQIAFRETALASNISWYQVPSTKREIGPADFFDFKIFPLRLSIGFR